MVKLRQYIPRLAAGAYILNSGLSKRGADEETAQGLHGMAAGTYSFLGDVEPKQFTKTLSTAEIALGAALVAPFVPTGLVGGFMSLIRRPVAEQAAQGAVLAEVEVLDVLETVSANGAAHIVDFIHAIARGKNQPGIYLTVWSHNDSP